LTLRKLKFLKCCGRKFSTNAKPPVKGCQLLNRSSLIIQLQQLFEFLTAGIAGYIEALEIKDDDIN
jgi:hypothetical protein